MSEIKVGDVVRVLEDCGDGYKRGDVMIVLEAFEVTEELQLGRSVLDDPAGGWAPFECVQKVGSLQDYFDRVRRSLDPLPELVVNKPTDPCPEFGPALRSWRRGREMAQETVGGLVGYSDTTVSNVESGKATLNRARARAWALALGMDFDAGWAPEV